MADKFCYNCGEFTFCQSCEVPPPTTPLVWTDAKPTVPGPYWVEDGGEEVVTVFEIDGELRVYVPGVRYSISLDEFCRRAGGRRLRFAGPIPQPEEPR